MARKKKKETAQTIEALRKSLQSEYGEEVVRVYAEAQPRPTISTGIIALDKALGGGVPRGRMIELYGNPSSGKTTIALSIVANAQKEFPDKTCVYVDAEHALDTVWAHKLGVDLGKFDHVSPRYGENAIQIMEAYLQTGEASVVVLDSVAALMPKAEFDNEVGEANIGLQARLVSTAMKRLNSILNDLPDAMIVLINQKRAQIAGGGMSFGFEATKTTGGKALPFFMTTRLEVVKTRTAKASDETEIGQDVMVKVIKNKVNKGPGAKIQFRIDNDIGIDRAHELLQYALEDGAVKKSGAWYEFADTGDKAQGEVAAKQVLADKYLDDFLQAYS